VLAESSKDAHKDLIVAAVLPSVDIAPVLSSPSNGVIRLIRPRIARNLDHEDN